MRRARMIIFFWGHRARNWLGRHPVSWFDLFALIAVTMFLAGYFPREVLQATTPATGGDTGSHFWPLHTLVHHGMFQGQLRVWNPGNLAGEPHLIHYFPFPFMLMGVMSYVMPVHIAFNIGTMLCVLLLPWAAYFCLSAMGAARPAPILAAAFSTVFLLTDTYSAWGGNIGSTLAGQFCHLYAIVFLLLGIGFYCRELRHFKAPLYSGVCFAAVALSHGYILMLLPLFAILLVLFLPIGRSWQRLVAISGAGVIALLLSCWWLMPMLDNNKWMTAYGDNWMRNLKPHEYAPYSLYPMVILALVFSNIPGLFSGTKALRLTEHFRILAIWLVIALVSVFMVWWFPKIGLVDIRAIPQIHLFICLIAALCLGAFVSQRGPRWKPVITAGLIVGSLLWAGQHGQHFKGWALWNYSGWDAKPLYRDFSRLADDLRGSLSEPRVIYEHAAEINNRAGTPRLFENLPYFAQRATLESLYMQASPISGPVYAAQAMVSLRPSCPFPNFRCPQRNFPQQAAGLKLLGVRDLILVTPEIRGEVEASELVGKTVQRGPWYLYRFKEEVPLVRLLNQVPELAPEVAWRDDAYQWFLSYRPSSNFRVLGSTMAERERGLLVQAASQPSSPWQAPVHCQAEVTPSFSGIELKTNCPGYAHLLKFSYHHAFAADTGDKPFLIYPGFIGLIPSASEVTLTFGAIKTWQFWALVSLLAAVMWVVAWLFEGYCHRSWRQLANLVENMA